MKVILAVHCHQPFGNLDHVVEEACERAYVPLLDELLRRPGLPFDLHVSGPLLEWIEEHRPDLDERLGGGDEQIEWMGGGWSEPILPAIPEADRIEQIRLLSDHVTERFGHRPRGLWLAERVWDPTLPSTLSAAGMEYVPLDDSMLLASGTHELTEPVTAEHLGSTVVVFPIAERFRRSVPDRDPGEVLSELHRVHDRDPDGLVVLADDAEKFGMWPGTHERVHGPGGWLATFLDALEEADWIELSTFERLLDERPPMARVVPDTSSYRELTLWALPAEARAGLEDEWRKLEEAASPALPYLRGAPWPAFLTKYPEANTIYRKMLRLSHHLADGRAPTSARRALFEGQCNDAYWHGAFGGLFLPHLRATVQERLIEGRRLFDGATHRGRSWSHAVTLDWDADGREELHVELPDLSLVVSGHRGGSLEYLDDKRSTWPVSDVVARTPEAYHREGDGPYDLHPRRWLFDHLLAGQVGAEAFADGIHGDDATIRDLEIEEIDRGRGEVTVTMVGRRSTASIRKTVHVHDRALSITYDLDHLPPGRFGPELPVSVWAGAGTIRADGGEWRSTDVPGRLAGHRFRFRHHGRQTEMTVSLPIPGEMYVAPIVTRTRREDGSVHAVMQGAVLWPHWHTSGSGRHHLEIGLSDMPPSDQAMEDHS